MVALRFRSTSRLFRAVKNIMEIAPLSYYGAGGEPGVEPEAHMQRLTTIILRGVRIDRRTRYAEILYLDGILSGISLWLPYGGAFLLVCGYPPVIIAEKRRIYDMAKFTKLQRLF